RRACDNSSGVCQTVPGPGQYTCAEREEYKVDVCQECLGDSDCVAGSKCLELSEGDDFLGYFCMLKEGLQDAPQECETGVRPFVRPFESASVDGSVGTYCGLATTTCLGYQHFLAAACEDDSQCGEPGIED